MLAAFGTAGAQAFQFAGQKRASESGSAFMLSLSAVFGVAAGACLGEPLTARMLIGSALIVASAFVCGVLPEIVRKRGEREK